MKTAELAIPEQRTQVYMNLELTSSFSQLGHRISTN